jgi:hypothetical protein
MKRVDLGAPASGRLVRQHLAGKATVPFLKSRRDAGGPSVVVESAVARSTL